MKEIIASLEKTAAALRQLQADGKSTAESNQAIAHIDQALAAVTAHDLISAKPQA